MQGPTSTSLFYIVLCTAALLQLWGCANMIVHVLLYIYEGMMVRHVPSASHVQCIHTAQQCIHIVRNCKKVFTAESIRHAIPEQALSWPPVDPAARMHRHSQA